MVFVHAVFLLFFSNNYVFSMTIDLLDVSSMEPISPNYCNDSSTLDQAGLYKASLGQFLGYECSQEFYHCRWQSDGFRTYRKLCKTGLVYDVLGTQNCNYDYNVKTCGMTGGGPVSCNGTDFHCAMSGKCVPMSKRCDGRYDCALEEDEQNCPLCTAGEFACIVSEQCIPLDRRCNGLAECTDKTDENNCDVCGHGLFHCAKSDECIHIDERCDGRRQCPHGEDEMLCKKPSEEKKFTCQSRDLQIPMTQVCDGAAQCPDGSDEQYCEMGTAAGGAIVFSSNPNPPLPPAPAPTVEEEEDYEYDETTDASDGPFFPMLPMMPLAPRLVTPAPTLPPTTRATLATTRAAPRPAFNKPKPKPRIRIPQEMKPAVSVAPSRPNHHIVQPTLIEVTAAPAAMSKKTSKVTRPPRIRVPVDVPGKSIRYPTKSVSEMVEPRVTVPAQSVQPKTQVAQQLYSRPATQIAQQTYEVSPSMVTVEVTSPPRGQSAQESILAQLGSQMNSGMSPELLAKIQRILSEEMRSKRRRRPTSSRDAILSPSAILRTFTSRVQKIDN